MDKESIIELQKIDCNCNDCKFMERDLERFNKSLDDHHRWQLNYFNTIRNNLYKKAEEDYRVSFSASSERSYPDKNALQYHVVP